VESDPGVNAETLFPEAAAAWAATGRIDGAASYFPPDRPGLVADAQA
jgi:hypothetical protein